MEQRDRLARIDFLPVSLVNVEMRLRIEAAIGVAGSLPQIPVMISLNAHEPYTRVGYSSLEL